MKVEWTERGSLGKFVSFDMKLSLAVGMDSRTGEMKVRKPRIKTHTFTHIQIGNSTADSEKVKYNQPTKGGEIKGKKQEVRR